MNTSGRKKMAMKKKPVTGMKDILPKEMAIRDYCIALIKDTFTIHATDGKVDKIILFDRRSDPYQMNNIAMQHPKLVNRLKSQLKTWLQKTEDPFFNYL